MEKAASLATLLHGIRSPLATVTDAEPRRIMVRPVRLATASAMKLCVDPESMSARRSTSPTRSRICMVSLVCTPAIAWSEIRGSCASSVCSAGVSSSAASAKLLSRKKRRWHTRLCPRPNFSLQLKQSPCRRRSSISCADRRRTGLPSTVIVAAGLAATVGGAGRASCRGGAGSKPRSCCRGGAGGGASAAAH
uniref:Uncharacterized protein n=1 Tax=Arundo donax TaxID=35708 RepID=A0A0A9DL54_ARUDO